MGAIASRGELRMTLVRWLLLTVPLVLLLGVASGLVSNSGERNRWYAELAKPALTPPGWVFGTVWPILYALMGIAFAMVLAARGATWRGLAIALFVVQLALNLAWSPLVFGAHQLTLGAWWILLLLIVAAATAWAFAKVRRAAGWLLVPYLAWLAFATLLAFELHRLNPSAERLVPEGPHTQVKLR